MAERTFEKGTVYLETALEKRSYLVCVWRIGRFVDLWRYQV